MIFYDWEEGGYFFKNFVNGVEHLYFSYDSRASELVGKQTRCVTYAIYQHENTENEKKRK